MKPYLKFALMLLILCTAGGKESQAQGSLLKKVRQRTEEELVKGIFGEKEKSDESGTTVYPDQAGYEQGRSDGSISNTRGGGLTSTPPDVPVNIADAGSAFSRGDYRKARDAVRQAILGIEMEIGQNILDGLPGSVKGLPAVSEEDRVASMSIGFVGLTIERTYRGGDQQLKVTIGNDAAVLSAANLYMGSGAYASTDEPDHKQVNLKGYNGILKYDDNSGYTLSVSFGQSSVFVAEGINFESEQEIMAAAEEFDIEKIKKELGEQ